MTHRSLKLALLILAFSLSSALLGLIGGLAGASLRAPAMPPPLPPAYCPPPPAAACPVCPDVTPPPPARRGVLYTATGFPEWGAGYETARLGDGDPSTYWCSPASPALPATATLLFELPAFVEAVELDNRIAGYATSGAREVRLEALDLGGAVLRSTTATLTQDSSTVVPLPLGVVASGVRVTVLSTFGGEYAAIAEIVVHGTVAR